MFALMPLFWSSDTWRTRVSRFANPATSEAHAGSPPRIARQSSSFGYVWASTRKRSYSQYVDRRIEDGHDDGDEWLSRQRVPAQPLGLELDRVGLGAGAPPFVARLDPVAVSALHLEAASGVEVSGPSRGRRTVGSIMVSTMAGKRRRRYRWAPIGTRVRRLRRSSRGRRRPCLR